MSPEISRIRNLGPVYCGFCMPCGNIIEVSSTILRKSCSILVERNSNSGEHFGQCLWLFERTSGQICKEMQPMLKLSGHGLGRNIIVKFVKNYKSILSYKFGGIKRLGIPLRCLGK